MSQPIMLKDLLITFRSSQWAEKLEALKNIRILDPAEMPGLSEALIKFPDYQNKRLYSKEASVSPEDIMKIAHTIRVMGDPPTGAPAPHQSRLQMLSQCFGQVQMLDDGSLAILAKFLTMQPAEMSLQKLLTDFSS